MPKNKENEKQPEAKESKVAEQEKAKEIIEEEKLSLENEEKLTEKIETEITEDEKDIEEKEAEEIQLSEEKPIEEVHKEEIVETKTEEITEETKTVEQEELKEVVEKEGLPEIPLEAKEEKEKIAVEEKEKAEEKFGFEVEKKKAVRKRKSPTLFIGITIGLILAVIIEVLFTIPFWLYGASRPDLYYIELVLILISMMVPGFLTRSVQKGILGAFIIFAASFLIPLLPALFGQTYLLGPLTPLFASTDFALDAYAIFKSLFEGLNDVPFERIQKWIWIVDLVLMFILTLLTVTFATWLLKNITKPKKKLRNWIAIPILSIFLIVFAIFTPIIFSSTYGIIQASTAFLAGSAKMQEAYGIFEESGTNPTTQQLDTIEDLLMDANYWMDISQSNYQGLTRIGLIDIAILASPKYGPLIQAGDQLALATLALTDILYPLFSGIFELIQNINNATKKMGEFPEPSVQGHYSNQEINPIEIQALEDIDELKQSIISAIDGMRAAKEILNNVLDKIDQNDISGAFDDVKATLDEIQIDELPPVVGNITSEIKEKLVDFDGQLTGFVDFIKYTNKTLGPTESILWTSYNSIVGNEYLRYYRFTDAKNAFQHAVDNITSIGSIEDYNPDSSLISVFSVSITNDYSKLLKDLLALMNPLLNEELEFAKTYEGLNNAIAIFASQPDITFINYSEVQLPIDLGKNTEIFGNQADLVLSDFRTNITNVEYGSSLNELGMNFEQILTEDFRPREFGQITAYMANISSHYITSCEAYTLQDFVGAIIHISIAADIMVNNTLPLILVDDPEYFKNYLNNWSLALTDLKNTMATYNSSILFGDGLVQIQIIIDDLELNIKEK